MEWNNSLSFNTIPFRVCIDQIMFFCCMKLLLISLVLWHAGHVQASPRSLMSCTASACTSAPVLNGCQGSINCYVFNTSSGGRICSPAPACSTFDVCSSNGSSCPSPNSMCVIDSCCSSPVCVPLSLINMCMNITVTTTTVAPSTSGCLSTAGFTELSSYNLITLANLSTTSDVENRTIICGSLVSGTSANFGIHIISSTNTSASYSLELNGQIVSGNGIQVNAGSFSVGPNPAHTITPSNNVSYTLDGRIVNINGGNQGSSINVNSNLPAKCNSLTSNLRTLSNSLAALSDTPGNNVTIPGAQSGPLNFYVKNVDTNGIAVFNLVGNRVLNNPQVQQIEIIIGANVTNLVQLIVINLSGTSITFGQGNFVGTWLTSISTGRARTIWNLPQVTSLTISRNWMGALLAPYAIVTASVNIDGAAAVLSLTTTAELHDPPLLLPPCITSSVVNSSGLSSHASTASTIQVPSRKTILLFLFSSFLLNVGFQLF